MDHDSNPADHKLWPHNYNEKLKGNTIPIKMLSNYKAKFTLGVATAPSGSWKCSLKF